MVPRQRVECFWFEHDLGEHGVGLVFRHLACHHIVRPGGEQDMRCFIECRCAVAFRIGLIGRADFLLCRWLGLYRLVENLADHGFILGFPKTRRKLHWCGHDPAPLRLLQDHCTNRQRPRRRHPGHARFALRRRMVLRFRGNQFRRDRFAIDGDIGEGLFHGLCPRFALCLRVRTIW